VNNTGTDDGRIQPKGAQCHECEGFGHNRTECATFSKKQEKSLSASSFNENAQNGMMKVMLLGRRMS